MVTYLESTPIPVFRDALPQAFRCAVLPRPKHAGDSALGLDSAVHARCGRGLGLAIRALAVRTTRPCNLPSFVLREAEFAGATTCPLRMVVRVLIERDGIRRVSVAEDITAAPAVVSSSEVSECSGACGFVANGSFRVGL